MGGATGGSNLGAAQGSITIEMRQALQAVPVMAGIAANIEREMGGIGDATKKVEANLGNLRSTFEELAGAFGVSFGIAGAVNMARMGVEMANTAATAEGTARSFERLAAGVGATSDEMLAAMSEASAGTVSDAQMILSANRAIVGGVADSAEELAQVMTVARATGQAFGFSTAEAFERLVSSVSRLETGSLDELGVTMRLDTVFRAYAITLGKTSDELTELERKQAVLEEVMRQTAPTVAAAGDSADSAAAQIGQLSAAWDNHTVAVGDAINRSNELVQATGGITGVLTTVTGALQTGIDWWDQYTGAVRKAGEEFNNWMVAQGVPGLTPISDEVPAWMTGVSPAASAPLKPETDPRVEQAFEELGEAEAEIIRREGQERVDAQAEYEQRRSDVINDYNRQIARGAEDFARQQARAEADYQQAVAEVHEAAAERERKAAEDLARDMARLQADNAKQQARWLRDLNESIAEAQADSAERLADRQADYDERLAEARGDSAERIQELQGEHDERIQEARADSLSRLAEMEEDYQEERARAAADHGDTITDAAARLDARAVWEEQRRYAREQKEAEEAHAESVAEEQERLADVEAEENKSNDKAIAAEQKRLAEFEAEQKKSHDKMMAQEEENLGERIEQEKEAHQERVDDANEALDQRLRDLQDANRLQLDEAKKADDKRLSDMQTAHGNEQREANEDYGIRLGRLQDDHEAQLGEMTTQHGKRLTQIGTHAQDERKHLHDEFVKRLKQLGVSEYDLETEQYNHLNRELKAQQDHYDDLEREQLNHQIRMLKILQENELLTEEEAQALANSIAKLEIALERIGGPGRHVDPRGAPIQTEPIITPFDQPFGGPRLAGASVIIPANAQIVGSPGGSKYGNFVIESGAIQISALPGMSTSALGDEFERRLLTVIRRISGSRL